MARGGLFGDAGAAQPEEIVAERLRIRVENDVDHGAMTIMPALTPALPSETFART
jgi:hypothetical protein